MYNQKSFFIREATWGKIFTIDQLHRRGFRLLNWCYLCLEDDETMEHLLLHCVKTRFLWELLFSLWCYVSESQVSVGHTVQLDRFLGR